MTRPYVAFLLSLLAAAAALLVVTAEGAGSLVLPPLMP